ncbi:MAG TPA: hypothetical protein VMP67_10105 [Candidatus Limnocylindria bacterium]|nr:hypothetical protein [Candidatus Limnocylindria bacterium]
MSKIELKRSFQFGKPLPLDTLPPETIERLRAGGEITPAELAIVQAAALRDAGPFGELVQAALSSQSEVSRSSGDSVDTAATPALAEGNFVAVPGGGVRTFEWRWPGEGGQETADFEPATYYEALTGKRDPQRNFFITARRVMNVGVWVIALGLPIGLITLAIATGQTLETIVWVGIGASIVGMMFRVSFPRTPFD